MTIHGYDFAGRLVSVTDHAGNLTRYTYHPNNHPSAGLPWTTTNPENEVTESLYNTRGQLTETTGNGAHRVTYHYNDLGERDEMRTYRTANSAGDLTQWTHAPATGLLLEKTDAAGKTTTYTYHSTGRLHTRVWARPGAITTTYTHNPSGGITHTHGYIPGTGTLSSLTTSVSAGTILTRTLYHDRMGRLFGIATANGSGATLSRLGYTLDQAGRRVKATRENGQRWDYGYDTIGQVTSGVKKFPNGDPIPGHTFAYQYDGIGNRSPGDATHWPVIQGGTGTGVKYTTNALNQYTGITTEGGRFILGEAPPADPVIINGDAQNPAARPGGLGFYWKQITSDNSSGPLWSTDTVTSGGVTITGQAWTPAASVTPGYDFDGNLTNDGRWAYVWDAENRLIRMTTTPAAADVAGVPRQRLDFVYDSQGRRVSKTVSTSPDGTTWTVTSDRRFLYDGWNLIAEYSAPSPTSTTLTHEASYIWGIDLSGTMQGAGGIHALPPPRTSAWK